MQSPASQQKEFGRRTARPALRPEPGERARARDTRVIQGAAPGLATRDFLKSGATLHMGKAGPDARRRAAAVLAVTGGLLYGAAIAPHALSGGHDVRNVVVAGADLSKVLTKPFLDRIAVMAEREQASAAEVASPEAAPDAARFVVDSRTGIVGVAASGPASADADPHGTLSESLQNGATAVRRAVEDGATSLAAKAAGNARHMAEGASELASRGYDTLRRAAVDAGSMPGRIAVAASDAVSDAVGKTRHALDEAGRSVRTAANDFVDGQVGEMRKSAGMIAEGLAPLVAQVAEAAVEARQMLIEDLERQSKLAEIEKTGVVVDIPGFKSYASSEEIEAQVNRTMAALVDGVERRIAANTPAPAKVSLAQPKVAWATPKAVTPGKVQLARAPAGSDEAKTSLASTSPDIALTQRAGYRVDGDTVHIGGSAIKASTVAAIAHAARVTHNDPVYLASLSGREANFKTHDNARTSSAAGPFQFIVDTWFRAVKDFGAKLGFGSVADEIKPAKRGYTVADPSRKKAILAMREDPMMSGLVVSEMEKSDRQVLEKALGRQATAGERYMPHFLGIGDAVRMVSLARTNPSAPAADYFKKAAGANRSLFYGKDGHKYSVAQVIGGFKNWFEGPNGGMTRYAAFEKAADAVPVPAEVLATAARVSAAPAPAASDAGRSAPPNAAAVPAAPPHAARAARESGRVRTASAGSEAGFFMRNAMAMRDPLTGELLSGRPEAGAKPTVGGRVSPPDAGQSAVAVAKTADPSLRQEAAFVGSRGTDALQKAASADRARLHETRGRAPAPIAGVDRPVQTASLNPNDQIRAEPAVSAPQAGASPTASAGEEFEVKWVRTPIVPGKPATFTAGGQIGGYVDAKGLLKGYATSLARSRIIEGFGENFSRLPAELQNHLQNAAQFDLNFIAQYAHRWMPKGMRDGFAEHGLTFIAAVPQTGGKMVAVKVPKPKEAVVAAVEASTQPAASGGGQTRSAAPAKSVDAAATTAEIDETMAENVREMPRGVATDPEGAAFELATASAAPADELETLKQQPLTQNRDVFAGMTRPALPPIPSGLDRELAPASPMPIVQIDWTPWDKPEQARDRHQAFGRSEEEARRSAALHSGIRIERRHPPAEIHHVEARRAPPAEPAYEPMRPRGP